MAISSAVIESASNIAWSSGDLFDGYAVFLLVPPEGYSSLVFEDNGVRASSRYVVPIKAGVLNSTVKVPYNASFSPPNSQYRVFFVDKGLAQIAAGVGLVTISDDPYTLTIPTLTAPVAEDTPPSLDVLTEVPVVGGFTDEAITGTKNGSNTAFTISRNAAVVVVRFDGQVIDEGIGYTRSGVNITAVAPKIPDSTTSYRAFLIG